MNFNPFYNEILTDHNLHPLHRRTMENANLVLEGVNPACGDDLVIQLREENGYITDGAYAGSGCAISQASADIMRDMCIGTSKDEALHLADLFLRMIRKDITAEELEELEEAGALQDISHMPSRVKCAGLSWHTMQEMLDI